MPRNVALIFAALLSLLLTAPSTFAIVSTSTLTILPEDCNLRSGEELSLRLDGFIPPDSVVTWSTDSGGITSMLPGSNAIFIAPLESARVIISVSISSAAQDGETVIQRECAVTAPSNAPRGLARATQNVAASTCDVHSPIN